jgi:hypothetical protein
MNILEKNMWALKENNPVLAEAVASCDGGQYHIIPSADDRLPNLIYSGENGEILFYDPTDPLGHIKATLSSLGLERAPFVILLGLGLGYQLNLLYSALQGAGPLRKVILVEKDIHCLRRAMEVLDISEAFAHEQIKLVVGSPETDLYVNLWNTMAPEFGDLKAIRFIPWPAAIRLDPGYYQAAKKAVQDVAHSFIAERGNDPFDTLVAYENFFQNLPHYLGSPGVSQVKDLFPNRPGVIVAAGPSLNKNVHLLRMLDNRAVIFSADASAKVLHAHGISPHVITTVERTPGTEKFFEGLTGLEETVLGVASFTYPQTLASYPGPFLFMHRKYHFYEILGIGEDCFEMGGTTAHCAFSLAQHMGCNPIIFIGQDLAYGPDGVTHARGCAFGQRQAYAVDCESIEIPANAGGTVETCSLWLRLLREYERILQTSEGVAINATEGGARIRGTQEMTFRDAIEAYCADEFNPRETLLTHLSGKKRAVSLTTIKEGLEYLTVETDKVLQKSHAILQEISPLLRQIEQTGQDVPAHLSRDIIAASRRLGQSADDMMAAPLFASAGEYFMSVWVPLLIEWQVVSDRFKAQNWAEAYRLQLAEEGLGSIAQLCLSLLEALQKGRQQIEIS